jgi:hypothetical protein
MPVSSTEFMQSEKVEVTTEEDVSEERTTRRIFELLETTPWATPEATPAAMRPTTAPAAIAWPARGRQTTAVIRR